MREGALTVLLLLLFPVGAEHCRAEVGLWVLVPSSFTPVAPTFLAPGIGFVEDSFSTDRWRGGEFWDYSNALLIVYFIVLTLWYHYTTHHHSPLTDRVLIQVCKQLVYGGPCESSLSGNNDLYLQPLPSTSIPASAAPQMIGHYVLIRSDGRQSSVVTALGSSCKHRWSFSFLTGCWSFPAGLSSWEPRFTPLRKGIIYIKATFHKFQCIAFPLLF